MLDRNYALKQCFMTFIIVHLLFMSPAAPGRMKDTGVDPCVGIGGEDLDRLPVKEEVHEVVM